MRFGLGDPALLARSVADGVFSPLSVGWEHAYWAEGPEFAALSVADGGAVATWPDEIGVADLTQGSAGLQPTYRSGYAALGTQPAIEGDGGDVLVSASFASAMTQPITAVLIVRYEVAALRVALATGPFTADRKVFRTNTLFQMSAGSGLSSTGDTVKHLVTCYFSGVSSQMAIDGTVTASGDAGTGGFGLLSVFAETDAGAAMQGAIAFVGLYSGDARTDPQWASFKSWAATKYGITIA